MIEPNASSMPKPASPDPALDHGTIAEPPAAPAAVDEPPAAEMQDEKLSLVTKLAYGSGDLGTAITAALRSFFLLFFLTDVARLSPAAAGSVLLINRV